MRYVSKTVLKGIYKKRKPWAHKGQFGKLVVISGSRIYTGSPVFVGMAAYRAGCDMVYLTGPQRAMDVAANYSPALITKPLEGDYLEGKHVDKILTFIENSRATAVVIGPGLWRIDKTRKAINTLVEKIRIPMVIDADAIRAVSAIKGELKDKKILLTPHRNELFELTGVDVTENIKNNTSSFNYLMNSIMSLGIKTRYVYSGDRFRLKDGVVLEIVGPTREFLNFTSPNGLIGESEEFGSVETLIRYGNFSALLTGDSQASELEQALSFIQGKLSILQVPHHGSKTGLNAEILETLNPKLAVISVGDNNKYGHPTQEILQILEDKDIKTLRTDLNGEIEIISDGKVFQIKD